MKKTIIIIFMALAIAFLGAQPVISTFTMYKVEHEVELGDLNERFIEAPSHDVFIDNPCYMVSAYDLPAMRAFLMAAKAKYAEWAAAAKSNKVEEITKVMDIAPACPKVTIFWQFGGEWHQTRPTTVTAVFHVIEQGTMLSLSVPALESTSNQFIEFDQKLIGFFSSASDIQSLYDALADTHVDRYREEMQRQDDIFK